MDPAAVKLLLIHHQAMTLNPCLLFTLHERPSLFSSSMCAFTKYLFLLRNYYLHVDKKWNIFLFKNNFYNSFAHTEAIRLDVIACVTTQRKNVNTNRFLVKFGNMIKGSYLWSDYSLWTRYQSTS